jgi:uncharacterized protein YidB (DUF937 family)
MREPARRLYEELRALEGRAVAARRKEGLPSSRREAERAAKSWGVKLDSRRISSWLPDDPASAQVPRDTEADKVWALICVWSGWAGIPRQQQRYWRDLIDSAQPTQGRMRPGDVTWAGRPLSEVTDPFALEVHRPIQPGTPEQDLPALPAYVPRDHDREVQQVVSEAAAGQSRIAALVGGSSTGKTRACWEALALLPGQPKRWRLWHPIDPSRPAAALRELPAIRPRTVVWLNEAQFYLGAPGGLGEQVAAGLRELLRDPARGPVLVLATLWPEFWDVLTTRVPGDPDPHAQTRELLAGRAISVPSAFTQPQLRQLSDARDPRLAQAAEWAQDGQVIQFIAGAGELLARYRNAPAAAKALIHAAMDARRLGMGRALSHAFLEAAAPGYLTDAEWDQLGDDWLEQALAYAAAPCKGVRGPLTRIRPRPDVVPPAHHRTGPTYQLADYLDQHGRRTRRGQLGPASIWDALATHAASAEDLDRLGEFARDCGLYRHAAAFWTTATSLGSADAACELIRLLRQVSPDDVSSAARWVAVRADLDVTPGRDGCGEPVAGLLRQLQEAGAHETVRALADRAAAEASLGDTRDLATLLGTLSAAGQDDAARALAGRAAGQANPDDPGAVADLMRQLSAAGQGDAARTLADRAAASAALESPWDVADLLQALQEAGASDAVRTLLARDPGAHASLDGPLAIAGLIEGLHKAGDDEAARALAGRAAIHVGRNGAAWTVLARHTRDQASHDNPRSAAWFVQQMRTHEASYAARELARRFVAQARLEDPKGVANLLQALRQAGASDAVRTLLARDPCAHARLDDPQGVATLLRELRKTGDHEAAQALVNRDPAAHGRLDDPWAVAELLGELRATGAHQAARALAGKAATHAVQASRDNPRGVAMLLSTLREAGDDEAAQALLNPDLVANARLDDPVSAVVLLQALRAAEADDLVPALARRAASDASLDDPLAVSRLLGALREAKQDDAVRALLTRDPGAHVSLNDPRADAELLRQLRAAEARQAARALAGKAAAHASLADSQAVAALLRELQQAGEGGAVRTLLARDPGSHTNLDSPQAVAALLEEVHTAGDNHAVRALADRAVHEASLDSPADIAGLLNVLRTVGAEDAERALLARDPMAHLSLESRWHVARQLEQLRAAGHESLAQALLARAANAGSFDLLLELLPREATRYRFGREPDGTPSQPWNWQAPAGTSSGPWTT